MKPTTLILRAAGTNCDVEAAYASNWPAQDAFGAYQPLLASPAILADCQILAFPGGFSYGDDIAAGKILANQIAHHLGDAVHRFIEAGKPVIGICNGFQVLVKTDLLPGPLAGQTGQTATLTNNDSGRFIDRWIQLLPAQKQMHLDQRPGPIDLPIAHGEGKFVPADEAVRKALGISNRLPWSIRRRTIRNGSVDDIAGVCDSTGLVFGLMPHPERLCRSAATPRLEQPRPICRPKARACRFSATP